jgi:hypothetical protein
MEEGSEKFSDEMILSKFFKTFADQTMIACQDRADSIEV